MSKNLCLLFSLFLKDVGSDLACPLGGGYGVCAVCLCGNVLWFHIFLPSLLKQCCWKAFLQKDPTKTCQIFLQEWLKPQLLVFQSFVVSQFTALPLGGGVTFLILALRLTHVTRKPVFGVSNQVRLKPACLATETS